jgi:hypothetical protein
MARPSARVIASYFDGVKAIEVLDRPNVYCVEYQGKPVSLRYASYSNNEDTPNRYPRTAFTTMAPCANLVKQLNEQFATTDFTVSKKL